MESFETLQFFRGIANVVSHPFVTTTRKDRRPRDMPVDLHAAADEWFLKRFGVKFRSQALFVTSRLVIASGYGQQTVRILPLGNYRYCWSRTTSDLLAILKDAKASQVHALLDAAQYVDCALTEAHHTGHEVMLFCDEYVAIPVETTPPSGTASQGKDGKLILV